MIYQQIPVSIYTTIFNIENCEENCVDSILNQTHSNFEWVVVYDLEKDLKLFKNKIKEDNRV